MKFKIFLLSLFVAGLSVSVALAAAPQSGRGGQHHSIPSSTSGTTPTTESGKHKGKPSHEGADCKPKVALILKGDYVSGSADASGAGSFVMLVKKANGHGWNLDLVGKQATIMVDGNTKIRRKGHAKLSDFVAGDRLRVQIRMCKPAEGQAAPPQLLASKVNAHPAKPNDEGGSTIGSTTSGATSGSTTTAASTSTGATTQSS